MNKNDCELNIIESWTNDKYMQKTVLAMQF